jgi:hypothetical protein
MSIARPFFGPGSALDVGILSGRIAFISIIYDPAQSRQFGYVNASTLSALLPEYIIIFRLLLPRRFCLQMGQDEPLGNGPWPEEPARWRIYSNP